MSPDILQLLINSSGAAIVTGLFIYYLGGRDKHDRIMYDKFNQTIQEYMKENTKEKIELSKNIQRFTDVTEEQKKTITELKEVISQMYSELFKKVRIIKSYQEPTPTTAS